MKGKEILVDTNIIIYLLQGNDTLENVLQGKELYVSFITELELFGLYSAPDGYEKKVEALLNDCLIVPMDAGIMQHYTGPGPKLPRRFAPPRTRPRLKSPLLESVSYMNLNLRVAGLYLTPLAGFGVTGDN